MKTQKIISRRSFLQILGCAAAAAPVLSLPLRPVPLEVDLRTARTLFGLFGNCASQPVRSANMAIGNAARRATASSWAFARWDRTGILPRGKHDVGPLLGVYTSAWVGVVDFTLPPDVCPVPLHLPLRFPDEFVRRQRAHRIRLFRRAGLEVAHESHAGERSHI